MKTDLSSQLLLPFILMLFLTTLSCKSNQGYGQPVADIAAITRDLTSFMNYRDSNIILSREFTGLDTASAIIAKGAFLDSLSTGHYLPLKITSGHAKPSYRLYKLPDTASNDIKTIIRYWALQENAFYKLEGTEFPDFHFADMDGHLYSKASTRGKIVVLKCWFLACLPCLEEIPVLNKLKEEYADRKDILFISLCMDPRAEVEAYLKKNPFSYITIPGQDRFLNDTLKLNGYPTHFVIDKNGKIIRKTEDNREMVYALKKLLEAGK